MLLGSSWMILLFWSPLDGACSCSGIYFPLAAKFGKLSSKDDGSSFKAALLSGPPGVGKTTTASLVCQVGVAGKVKPCSDYIALVCMCSVCIAVCKPTVYIFLASSLALAMFVTPSFKKQYYSGWVWRCMPIYIPALGRQVYVVSSRTHRLFQKSQRKQTTAPKPTILLASVITSISP